jgi:pimeloyl-ACP methyl ester carboxylesterase
MTPLRLPHGRTLAFAEYGVPDGLPVFAVHGTPGSHRWMAPFDAAARTLGVRVIAPDRPGYGASSYDPGRRIADWPHAVAAIADSLGLTRFGVLGHSGGGPHAAACAAALGPRLFGVGIVSGIGPLGAGATSAGMMPANRLNVRLARVSPALVRPIMAWFLFGLKRFPVRAIAGFQRMLPPPDQHLLARADVRAMVTEDGGTATTAARAAAQDFGLFVRPWGFRLEDITIPVHLWHGDLDANVPYAHGWLQAARIPNATLHSCPGEGHLLYVDRTEEILAAVIGPR